MYAKDFIEFSASTPEHLRLRGGVTKYIHRRALKGFLPQEVIGRTTKGEYSICFNGHLDELSKHFDESQQRLAGLAEPTSVKRLLAAHRDESTSENRMWELWGIYGASILR